MAWQMIRMDMVSIWERGSNMENKNQKDREICCYISDCVGDTGMFFCTIC